jgi:hypothetical protein
VAHCRGTEVRYRKTICEAVSDKLHLEGVAERLCRQSDLWSGVGEETRVAPDPPRQRKRSAIVDGRATIFESEMPLKCLGPTQRCFSECLL